MEESCSENVRSDFEPNKVKDCDTSYNTWPHKFCSVSKDCDPSVQFSSLHSVNQSPTKPMTMEVALANLNITYSPSSKCLQGADKKEVSQNVVNDENKYTYYKPGHRKAYSLPRTLEGVDEDGSIARPVVDHDVVVESPRTTLQRYGIPYQPYDFRPEPEVEAGSTVSEISGGGVSDRASDLSSLGDSGVYSETSRGRERRGIGELLYKGFAANLKILSKSGQQMVKLVKKDATDLEPSPTVSSQSLIMEARPPGVPAKSAKEQEKHSAEHERMVERIRRKETTEGRTRAQRLAEQRRMEDDLSELTSYWQTVIIPNWASVASSKKTQSLWWRGLPPPIRGRVWRLGLSNTLNLTPQLYTILTKRAKDQLEAPRTGAGSKEELSREETLELIRLDVSRTFPQLCIFQRGGPYFDLLHNILGAYVCYRPDIGYVQGMSFIAAILILNLDEPDAFIMLANILNWPLLASFFTVDQDQMENCYSCFTKQLSSTLPQLAAHFSRLGLRPDLYLLDWIMTLYSRPCPLDVTCRIWDLVIRDGESFLLKTALGILSLYEETLLKETDFVHIAQFLSKLPDDINPDKLFDKIETISTSTSKRTFPSLAPFW